MVKQKKNVHARTRRSGITKWSLSSLGIIVVVLLLALGGLLVLMRNAAEEHLQQFSAKESSVLYQLSANLDTIDVDVLDSQTQLLPEDQ